MTDILAANLENIALLLRRDWDWLVCIDGYERVGKSTLALQMCLLIDPNFDLSHVVFDWNDLKRVATSLPKYSAIFYDEARMLTRERMKEWNIGMVQALSVIGFENQFFVFNFPDFWELDPYIKDHRCRTRAYVFSVKGHRGHAQFYLAKKRPFKSTRLKRSTWWEKGFRYSFYSLEDEEWPEETRELWRRYQEKEKEAKLRILGEEVVNPRKQFILRMKKAGHRDAIIADGLDIGERRVNQIVQELRREGLLTKM